MIIRSSLMSEYIRALLGNFGGGTKLVQCNKQRHYLRHLFCVDVNIDDIPERITQIDRKSFKLLKAESFRFRRKM